MEDFYWLRGSMMVEINFPHTAEQRIRRNDWGSLAPPPLGAWRPSRTVSVIIPGYQCQASLELTLAALHHQSYPPSLLEVVVVDDGSEPKLELPDLVPANCRTVRVSDYSTGWGRANALDVGVGCSDGEILHWLDADLIPFARHVEAQARWHHLVPDAVTLGYKRFVADGWTTPAEVAARCTAGTLGRLFPVDRTEPHDYVEELIDATDRLRDADHLVFRAHVGATAAVRRDLYRAAGGLDPELRLGEDSEFGYRLTQAGAVFIPEPAAQSWHMGPSHMMTRGAPLRRYNQPFLAERMAHPRWLRNSPGRIWSVPLVVAVVEVGSAPLELVRACVDRLLASAEQDLRVALVADWDALTDERRSVLADPLLERRLIAASYAAEPRVALVGAVPDSAFPSPYLLRVPARLGVGPDLVGRLVAVADEQRVGLLRVLPAGAGVGAAPPAVELWRTAAVSRARRHRRRGEDLADAVTAVYGARWLSAPDRDLIELTDQVAEPRRTPGSRPALPAPPGAVAGDPAVAVAGLRSWARATGHVARLGAGRAVRRVRTRVGARLRRTGGRRASLG